MATELIANPAYKAFEQQLKTLCLKEFPCGPGTWREGSKRKKQDNNAKVEGKFSITLKDYGANFEKTETLEEYVGSAKSPWQLDYSWSQEAKSLRELAVKSPWLISDNFVLGYFKTLRIVSKDVTEIDANLLQFQNLEELTLSCNRLATINSNNLPKSLKVLEVCANEVSSLQDLCEKPPRLIHLGLGYNRLSLIGDYLTGQYWPQLLSLDLSNNNLSDLLDVVNKVGSLPKLRNLVLQGNPLSLIPGYRGYTVDSLRKLNILDDIMISADERHYFKGLARRREYILDEAKVLLSVAYIKGVPMPQEMQHPEEQPEYPVIERKYFVQFMFLEDASLKTDNLQLMIEQDLADLVELSGFPSERTNITPQHEQSVADGDTEQQMVEKNVVFTEEPDAVQTIEAAVPPESSPSPDQGEKKKAEEESSTSIKTAAVDSAKQLWAEDMECNWTQSVVRDDLLSLRDFFRQGMQISVVEEMVEGYPPVEPTASQVAQAAKPAKKGGKDDGKGKKDDNKVKKDNTKDAKVKDAKPAAGKSGKDKDKKKKKEPEVELKREPPTYTTLATFHVPLADFLEGEFDYQSVYSKGFVEIAPSVKSQDSMKKFSSKLLALVLDMNKSKAKVADKKPPSAVKKPDAKDKDKDKGKGRGNSAKGGKKGAPAPPPEEEEEPGPPPPLEIQIAVHLHHWKTAMDLLKDEEERKKASEEVQETPHA